MQRRDFVKAMMAATVSARTMLGQQAQTPVPSAGPLPGAAPAPGPVPWMRGLMEVKPLQIVPVVPDAIAETNASFFTPEQMAALRKLSATLLPAYKTYPGAVEAGAPDFLDFLIGVSPSEAQELYRSGLDRLNREAHDEFGAPFAATAPAQADQLLRPWLRTWMSDHPPSNPYAHFINIAHSDIRTATLNSEAWSAAAKALGEEPAEIGLFWFPIDPDLRQPSRS